MVRKFAVPLLLAALICCARPAISRGAGPEPIKIGAVLPFSGGVEVYGRQAKLGLDLATAEINAHGGILGRPLEVIYQDDQTDPVVAIRATRTLIEQDGVFAVVGPITSRNLIAMEPTIESTKTPLLYATNYEGGACSRYIFSFSSVPNQELAPLIPYMDENFGNTYFMLGANHAWPQAMFKYAQPVILAMGGHVLGKEFTTGDEKDFAPLIDHISATKAKVLLFALKGDGLSFIPQADEMGFMKTTTIAFLGLSEADLPAFHGKGQNMYVVVPFVASSDMPSIKAFVGRVKAEAGADTVVSNYVMTHYDALMAMSAAVERAGKVDKEAMIDAMEGLKFQSPAGPITIGKNHHTTMNMFLAKTKDSELVTVRALGEIAPDPGCKSNE